MRKKLKLSMVSEYINLLCQRQMCFDLIKANSLHENELAKIIKAENRVKSLLDVYKKIFFRLRMMDISLAILEKNFFCEKDYAKSFFSDEGALSKIDEYLDENCRKLNKIIKKLRLNEFENNYLKLGIVKN